jgi:hypothetical protein
MMEQLDISEDIVDPYRFNINFKLPNSEYVLTISAKNSNTFNEIS